MSTARLIGRRTARRRTLAHAQAIDTTSHNVANANTEGYSRQEAVMSAAGALQLPVGMAGNNAASIGTGVDVTAFRRIRTNFLDLQYRAQAMQVGDQETLSTQ